MMLPRRRAFMLTGAALVALPWTSARALPNEVQALIQALTEGAPLQPGGVKLELPLLVENGNAVGMTVTGPPGTRSLHVFAERNPNPDVIAAHFGEAAAQPRLATRIRLATSQTVVAVAACADGTFWTDSVDLIVTLAACLE